EDDHIRIALPGGGVDRVRPRVAEEDERPPAHLVDRIVAGPVLDRDMWHGRSQLVHVFDPSGPAPIVGHIHTIFGTAGAGVVTDGVVVAGQARGRLVGVVQRGEYRLAGPPPGRPRSARASRRAPAGDGLAEGVDRQRWQG